MMEPGPTPVVVESSDTNTSIYYLPRRFAQTSKLHRYLAYKCPGFVNIKRKDYNLYEILLALKKVISSDKLFDPQNPTVILCDDFLEDALEVKAIHVSEIKDQVSKQFFLIEKEEQLQENLGGNTSHNSPPRNDNASPTTTTQTSNTTMVPTMTSAPNADSAQSTVASNAPAETAPAPVSNGDSFALPSWASTTANAVIARMNTSANFDIEGKYLAKPEFLKVLRAVEGVSQTQTVFHYREITSLLSQYIMANKNKFFDLRNIRIALVEHDQLGKAFGVKAFARSQVTSLLRAQLIPFKGIDEPMKETAENGPKSMEGIAIPSGSTSEDTTTLTRNESSGDETIYSAQGYETAPARTEPYSSSSDSSDSEDEKYSEENTYRVEFEVDNGTENEDEDEDKKKSECSDEDSDIDNVEVRPYKFHLKPEDTDFADWADSDSDFSDVSEDMEKLNFDSKVLPKGTEVWRCLTCKEPNNPFMKYCAMCWQDRKTWVPSRAKPRRRRRKSQSAAAKKVISGPKKSYSLPIDSLDCKMDDLTESVEGKPDSPDSAKYSDSGVGSTSSGCSQELDEIELDLKADIFMVDSGSETKIVSSRKRFRSDSGAFEISEKTNMIVDDSLMVMKSRKLESDIVVQNLTVLEDESALAPKLIKNYTIGTSHPAGLCTICYTNPKDACFIHGQCSHQVCCYQCAKKIVKNKESCPVCRRKIEKITRNFTY